ncbi:MAG TPA: aminotransferase class I/II-fold pyridoxal phosphate-dependent enzyme [Bacteroidia bacterium]|nr:aminotransferase class I/II-fold pyridoxal phosphate-dependent enzyme [Bacteroidia bacterium]
MDNKKKTGNIIDSVNDIITLGKERGVLMQYTEDESYDGRIITIDGKPLVNFGSCSYLALDTDERIKDAAIEAIRKYGVQFSSSRTYLACTLYKEWEDLVSKMFGAPIVLSTSVSLGHHAVIPVVIEEGDAIILDQQAHASMQEAAQRMQLKGCTVTILRHSRLDELENKIQELSATHNRVWYVIDGVYSMYGDYAPVKELVTLLDKYSSFYLYADDAHGMSTAGKNGTGVVLNQIELHEKMVLATSLNKAFAAGGGVFVFRSAELANKVKSCGGSMIFSGPHQIPSIAAGIASAKIHLSSEIAIRQEALRERLNYCHDLLVNKYGLPVISNPESPITFIGLGLTRVGYNMAKRMKDDGFFTNLAIFPAVPEVCTGLRFTITLHHTFEDIKNLAEKLAYHFPKALADEGRTLKDVHRAFRKVAKFKEIEEPISPVINTLLNGYTLQHETTIKNIDEKLWNERMGKTATNDWQKMMFFEQTFTGNPLPEHNWSFHYYIIRDAAGTPVLTTFFTATLAKDDMFAPAAVSKQLEKLRKNNKYYLSSKILTMGSLFTMGEHIWIDRTRNNWKQIAMLLLDRVWEDQEKEQASVISLRDFDPADKEMKEFFMDQGFIALDLLDSHVVDKLTWADAEAYVQTLDRKKRYHVRKEAFDFESRYEVNIVKNASAETIEHFYQLYRNVSARNYEIMGFELHKAFFKNVLSSSGWEVIELKLKPEFDSRPDRKAVSMAISYKAENSYDFLIVGIDYTYLEEHNVYAQTLWQAIKRARQVDAKAINMGLTASLNKRKFGARVIKNAMYVQTKDSYNASVIASMANNKMAAEV